MTMILVAVDFDAPIALPGKRAETTFPPPTAGWAGFIGWRMYVEDGRLCIVSPPGEASLSKAALAEMEANGISPSDVSHLVSIPLHRCTLRYVGAGTMVSDAPSPKLEKQMRGEEKPPAPVLPATVIGPQTATVVADKAAKAVAKKSPPPQNNAPQPLRRPGPPGAKPLVMPPVSKEIEMDGEMPKSKRAVSALESEPQ